MLIRFPLSAWATPNELFKLTKQDLEAAVKSKKEAQLRRAYEIALEEDWIETDLEERQLRLASKIEEAKERKANPGLKRAEEEHEGQKPSKRRRVSFQDQEYDPSKAAVVTASPKRDKPSGAVIKRRAPSPLHAPSVKTPATPQMNTEEGVQHCTRWRHLLQKAFLSKKPLSELVGL
jgi:hypothetical protein